MQDHTQAPVYLIAALGRGHLPFLHPCLYSIGRADPNAETLVLHSGDDSREIELLELACPNATFVRSEPLCGTDAHARIAHKMQAWALACTIAADRWPDRPVVLLDADTIVLQPVFQALPTDFDAAFTVKNQGFPINTGVLLARSSAAGHALCSELDRRAREIASDQARFEQAKDASGAADQHALRELLADAGADNPAAVSCISVPIGGVGLALRALPCDEFNHTECVPLTDDTRIVHYKSGWHPILLHQAPFTANRPASKCQHLLDLFRDVEREASRTLARRVVTHACAKHAESFARMIQALDEQLPFAERGVLHSEMFAACATAALLRTNLVIESGRYLGQSTRVLARWMQEHSGKVISYERLRDQVAAEAEQALRAEVNVDLRYGDATHAIPRAISSTGTTRERTCVFLDGPKGTPANDLARGALDHAHVHLACIHDARRDTPGREELEGDSAARVFFTDDDEFVEAFGELDLACITKDASDGNPGPHDWSPYRRGTTPRRSYGPTLAIWLPSPCRTIGTREVGPAQPTPRSSSTDRTMCVATMPSESIRC